MVERKVVEKKKKFIASWFWFPAPTLSESGFAPLQAQILRDIMNFLLKHTEKTHSPLHAIDL